MARSRALNHWRRRLAVESLEARWLLAGDTLAFHNFAVPEDVDASGDVVPLDVLLIVNELSGSSNNASQPLAEGEAAHRFLDVSGDGIVSPLDALLAINRLNRGLDTPSGVPLATRLTAAKQALEAGALPAMSMAEAEDVIATLEAGGFPELGQRLLGGQVINLGRVAAIVEQVADLTANWSTEAGSIIDRVANFLDTANTETPLLGQITSLLEDLGVHVGPIGDEIDEIVNAATGVDGSLRDILEGWQVARESGESPILELFGQLRDTLTANRNSIDAILNDLSGKLQQGALGERFPRLREILTDGTPIQDLLDEVETVLGDPGELSQLGSSIDDLIGSFLNVPFRLGDTLDQILNRGRDEAHSRVFADFGGGILDLFL